MLRCNALSAESARETKTFNLRPTMLRRFGDRCLLMGDPAVATRGDRNAELVGVSDVGRDHGWTVKHVISVAADPAGMVMRGACEALVSPLVAVRVTGKAYS